MKIEAELTGNNPKKRKDGNILVLEFTVRRNSLTAAQRTALTEGWGSNWDLGMTRVDQNLGSGDGEQDLVDEATEAQDASSPFGGDDGEIGPDGLTVVGRAQVQAEEAARPE